MEDSLSLVERHVSRVLAQLILQYMLPVFRGSLRDTVRNTHFRQEIHSIESIPFSSEYLLCGSHEISIWSQDHKFVCTYRDFEAGFQQDVAGDGQCLYVVSKHSSSCQKWNYKTQRLKSPQVFVFGKRNVPLISVCVSKKRLYFLYRDSVCAKDRHTNRDSCLRILDVNDQWRWIRWFSGRLFLFSPNRKQIMRIHPHSGQKLAHFDFKELPCPRSFVVMGDEIYVLDVHDERLYCFWMPTGACLGSWHLAGNPLGMALGGGDQRILVHYQGSRKLDVWE